MYNRRFCGVIAAFLCVVAVALADRNYGVGNRRYVQQQIRNQPNTVPNWNQLFGLSVGGTRNVALRETQQLNDIENYDEDDENDSFDDEETMDDIDTQSDFDDEETVAPNDVIGFLLGGNDNLRFPMQQFDRGSPAGAILVPDGLMQVDGQGYFDEESGEQSLLLPRDALNGIPEGSIVALVDGTDEDLGKANRVIIRRRNVGNNKRRRGNRRRGNRRRGNKRVGNRKVSVYRGRPINIGGNNGGGQRRRRRGNRRRQPSVIRVPAF